MNKFPLEKALGASRRHLEEAGPDVDASWASFQGRLATRGTLPKAPARKWPVWWAIGSLAACLAIAGGVFLSRPPQARPPVVLEKPESRIEDLRQARDYHFTVAAVVQTVPENTVRFEAGSTAKLIRSVPQGAAWEIKQGSVKVDNHTGSRFANIFVGGGYRFEELGTAFDLSVEETAVSLTVREGQVRVFRADPPFDKTLTRGESWQDVRVPVKPSVPVVEPVVPPIPPAAPRPRASLPRLSEITAGARLSHRAPGLARVLRDRDLITFAEQPAGGWMETGRLTLDLPPQPWFLEQVGPWTVIGDRSEYLYFYDGAGSRKGVRVGSLSGSHVYPGVNRTLVVNATGELLELGPDLKVVNRQKALSGILFEGCVDGAGKYLYLPDLAAQVVVVDLETRALRQIALPAPAAGNLAVKGGSVWVPGPNLSVK